MNKDSAIVTLLSALDLDKRGWTVVDYWEADATAIGIARAAAPRRLVYVSTFNKDKGRYDYECEVPSGSDETEYDSTDHGSSVAYTDLVRVLEKHLG